MLQKTIKNRTIYCKDNLDILQGINSNSIDLIYLDPPFNKKKTFHAPIGSSSEGASFKDIFREEDVKEEWTQTIKEDNDKLHTFLESVKTIEGRTSYNFCYLTYMSIRLIECHRVLKEAGSLYLHCDPTMSHYLKILLDIIFGEKNFRNEIVWCYAGGGISKRWLPKKHDIILWYSKTDFYSYKAPLRKYSITGSGRHSDGSKYDKEKDKTPCNDWWLDLSPVNTMSKERTDYPTQKPLTLLERIIKASSKEEDIVLDPFCGCATTCVASEKLGRQWIGIDISVKAYELVKERLKKEVANPEYLTQYQTEVNFSTTPPMRTDINRDDTRLKKYVYVISNPKYKGMYKVGIANDYKSRLNSYQTSDPYRGYKLEYQVHTHLFRETEKHIHDKFNNMLEWVKADLKDIIREIDGYLK